MSIDVSIISMKTSGPNKIEHFVRITCEDRHTEVFMAPDRYVNRALYHRDNLRHVLLGWPAPDLLEEKYADPVSL